jgi:hypothetical protein
MIGNIAALKPTKHYISTCSLAFAEIFLPNTKTDTLTPVLLKGFPLSLLTLFFVGLNHN